MRITLIMAVLFVTGLTGNAQQRVDTIRVDSISTDSVAMEYFIQIASLKSAFERFPELSDLGYMFKIRHETKELFRYQLGIFENRESADKVLLLVRNRGFKDAFVIGRKTYEPRE